MDLTTRNRHNLGISTTASAFSTSSAAGDMVLRSLNRLILQSGGSGYGILIDSSNNTSFSGSINVSGTVQNKARIILSGQEFYQPGYTSGDGIALILGVNRANNKQLWITNSANLAQNGTNTCGNC